jgi:hypothetical protein
MSEISIKELRAILDRLPDDANVTLNVELTSPRPALLEEYERLRADLDWIRAERNHFELENENLRDLLYSPGIEDPDNLNLTQMGEIRRAVAAVSSYLLTDQGREAVRMFRENGNQQ